MRCERCGEHEALEQDGTPVRIRLFESWEGYACERCVLEIQEPYNLELRERVSELAPHLTAEELSRFPDQMLKFTVCLPLPREPRG